MWADVGGVQVLKGNGADLAKHCVPPVSAPRISVTFRRMGDRFRSKMGLPVGAAARSTGLNARSPSTPPPAASAPARVSQSPWAPQPTPPVSSRSPSSSSTAAAAAASPWIPR